jgi:hypothetical protein
MFTALNRGRLGWRHRKWRALRVEKQMKDTRRRARLL